jgi:glutathione synthase/RimK-type ligase-like ATP-grasp enzyme
VAPTLAIVTCAELPSGDEDGGLLIDAFVRRGIDARWRVWSDQDVAWASYDLALVRTPWDYTARRAEFLRWAWTVPNLENPAEVIAWNSDKTYLYELGERGIPIVPTAWAPPGAVAQFPAEDFVVKPSVGAGSMGAGRFTAGTRAQAAAHVAALHEAGRIAMVQPYLADVDRAGETGLIYLGGEFSHAIRKDAMLAPEAVNPLYSGFSRSLYVPERVSVRAPAQRELELGARVLDTIRTRWGRDLVYARIDLLPTDDGPVLIELEVTEPSLFLGYCDGSADRLAAAVERRLR